MLSRPDGFMLCGRLGVNFFSTAEFLYWNVKFNLQLFKARPCFHKIRDNPNNGLGIVGFSLFTCGIALKEDYQEKERTCLHNLPWISTIWRL